MSKLTLFHGSNALFDRVDLGRSRDRRDFGRGFYMTSIQEQAESWAMALFDRYGGDGAFLYAFEFDWDENLHCKIFEGLTKEWLEMVRDNRMFGGTQHNYARRAASVYTTIRRPAGKRRRLCVSIRFSGMAVGVKQPSNVS
jgi:hypothetical protein